MTLALAVGLLLTQAKPQVWHVVKLPEGFTVDAPVKLTPAPPNPAVPKLKMMVGVHREASFVAGLSQVVEETKADARSDELLASMVVGLVDSQASRIVGQRDILLSGWPGIEVEIDTELGIHGKLRGYAVAGRLFQTMVAWQKGKPVPSELERFLYSMVIPKRFGVGPQRKAGPEFATYTLAGADVSLRLPREPKKTETTMGMGIKVVRFEAPYGNRNYVCAYLSFPDEAAEEMSGQDKEIREKLNAEALAAMEARGRKDTLYKLGTKDVLSSTAKVGSFGAVRIDTFVHGLRAYSFIAATPEPLLVSEEVKAFFKSIKLG